MCLMIALKSAYTFPKAHVSILLRTANKAVVLTSADFLTAGILETN